MVFFTCSHCGESIKKPSVAKHYQTKCRKYEPFLTCVDCLKDFRGSEYEAHTKCVTEDERYSAKGYVPKPSQNKGERKQQAWQECIQTVLKKPTLRRDERELLIAISKYENVPRKKSKFVNFLSNAFRQYANKTDLIDRVWTEMETVFKNTSNGNEEQNIQEEKSSKDEPQPPSQNEISKIEENSAKKEKKRKRQDEKPSEISESGETEVKKKKQKSNEEKCSGNDAEALIPGDEEKEGKKNRKRKAEENGQIVQNDSVTDEPEQGKKKKKKKHEKSTNGDISEIPSEIPEPETKKKKKNKKSKLENVETEDVPETPATENDTITKIKKKEKKSENKENCGGEPENQTEKEKETSKKKKPKEDAVSETEKQETFDWKATILNVLNKNGKNNKIQLPKLQKKVLKLHSQILNCENSEKIVKKFMKKLKDIPQIEIDNELVVLKS